MVRKETITVPETTVLKTMTFCDECKREISYARKCKECGADLCMRCSADHPEDVGGDYTDYICKSCKSVFAKYYPDLQELEEKQDAIYKARNNKCIEERKKLTDETNKT